MGRVQLLRRQIDSYQRKYDSYAQRLETYNNAATAYNKGVEAIRAGSTGINESSPGQYQRVIGVEGQIQPGRPVEVLSADVATGMVWEDPGVTINNYEWGSEQVPNREREIYSKNADGTFTQYQPQQTGTQVLTNPETGVESNSPILTWQPVAGTSIPTLNFNQTAPVLDPRLERGPNLTEADERLLDSPTQNPAQQNQVQAWGGSPNSELAGDAEPTRNSAFFDLQGDDPKGVADKGVLQRVLSGQL